MDNKQSRKVKIISADPEYWYFPFIGQHIEIKEKSYENDYIAVDRYCKPDGYLINTGLIKKTDVDFI